MAVFDNTESLGTWRLIRDWSYLLTFRTYIHMPVHTYGKHTSRLNRSSFHLFILYYNSWESCFFPCLVHFCLSFFLSFRRRNLTTSPKRMASNPISQLPPKPRNLTRAKVIEQKRHGTGSRAGGLLSVARRTAFCCMSALSKDYFLLHVFFVPCLLLSCFLVSFACSQRWCGKFMRCFPFFDLYLTLWFSDSLSLCLLVSFWCMEEERRMEEERHVWRKRGMWLRVTLHQNDCLTLLQNDFCIKMIVHSTSA